MLEVPQHRRARAAPGRVIDGGSRDGMQWSFFVSESGWVEVRLHCAFRSQPGSFSFLSSSVFHARTLSALYASGQWPARSRMNGAN